MPDLVGCLPLYFCRWIGSREKHREDRKGRAIREERGSFFSSPIKEGDELMAVPLRHTDDRYDSIKSNHALQERDAIHSRWRSDDLPFVRKISIAISIRGSLVETRTNAVCTAWRRISPLVRERGKRLERASQCGAAYRSLTLNYTGLSRGS